MSDCEFYRELIELNLLGECSEEEMLLLNEHLKECPSCKEEARFAFNVQNTLRSLPKKEVPDNFLMSLNEKLDLEDEIKAKAPDIRYNRFVNSWKKYSALTACLLLAVLVKINVWDISNTPKTDDASIDDTHSVTVINPSSEEVTSDNIEVLEEALENNTQAPVLPPVVTEAPKPTSSPVVTKAPVKKEAPVNTAKETEPVYVVKAATPHSKAKTPENTENVVVLDSTPKNQRVKLDDYKIMVTDEFLQTCYVDEIPSNKVIVATSGNVNSAKSVNVDTSSLNLPKTSNGAGSGSLLVSSSDEEIVQDILKKYSLKAENNTFMLSSENYKSFITELKVSGIYYRDYMIHSKNANVAFQLIVS